MTTASSVPRGIKTGLLNRTEAGSGFYEAAGRLRDWVLEEDEGQEVAEECVMKRLDASENQSRFNDGVRERNEEKRKGRVAIK